LQGKRYIDDKAVKPFLEHLEDLRRTIILCLVSLAVAMAIAVPLAPWILSVLKVPLRQAGQDPERMLRVIEVTGGLSIAMTVILWSGVLLSAPFAVIFICRFVFPGLTAVEKRTVVQAMVLAVALFVGGIIVGYRLILVVTLRWMFGISAWLGIPVEFVRVNDYVTLILKLLLIFGLSFEFPVVVLALAKLGLVDVRFLAGKRRHVIVVLLFLAAVVTPTVDPLTQLLVAAPLYVLYELCVWGVWAMERRKKRVP